MQSAGIPAPQFALPTVGIRASRSDLIGGSVVFFGSLLAAAFSLQLWHAHLGSPFDYDSGLPGNGDTVIYTAMR